MARQQLSQIKQNIFSWFIDHSDKNYEICYKEFIEEFKNSELLKFYALKLLQII